MKPSELLKDEKNWTKRANARNNKGLTVLPSTHESAISWCLLGACIKTGYATEENRKKLNAGPDWINLTKFNDSPETKHEDVLKLLLSVGL
jgi:hypothetical protein